MWLAGCKLAMLFLLAMNNRNILKAVLRMVWFLMRTRAFKWLGVLTFSLFVFALKQNMKIAMQPFFVMICACNSQRHFCIKVHKHCCSHVLFYNAFIFQEENGGNYITPATERSSQEEHQDPQSLREIRMLASGSSRKAGKSHNTHS